jgi:hypothetical protein
LALWILGFQDTGLPEIEKAVAGAQVRKRAADLLTTLAPACTTYFLGRRFETAVSLTTQLDAVSNGLLQCKPVGAAFRGVVSSVDDDGADAVELIAPAHAALTQTGMNLDFGSNF